MAWTNVTIGYLNYVYTSTITTGEEQINFPATNVALDLRDAVWKTNNGTVDANKYIDIAFGSSLQVDLISLFDLNTNNGNDAIGINLSLWTATTTSLYRLTPAGSAAHIPQRHLSFFTAEGLPRTASYAYINLNRAPVVEGHFVTGKIFVGRAITLSKSYVYGVQYTPISLTGSMRTRGGSEMLSRRKTYMTCRFSIPTQTKAQDDNVQSVIDYVGTGVPFPLLMDLSNDYGRKTFWGRFTRVPDLTIRNANMHDRSFEFQEIV